MKFLASLLTSLILAAWVAAIALVSVQNASPVALRFLSFQLVEMPFGLVLAFGTALGIVGTAIAQPLLGFSSVQSQDEDEDF